MRLAAALAGLALLCLCSAPPLHATDGDARLTIEERDLLQSWSGKSATAMLADAHARRVVFHALAILADRRSVPLNGDETPLLTTFAEAVPRARALTDPHMLAWGSEHCGLVCDAGTWFFVSRKTGDIAVGLYTRYDIDRRYAQHGFKTLFVMSCAAPEFKQAAFAKVQAEGEGIRERAAFAGRKDGPPVSIVETPCR